MRGDAAPLIDLNAIDFDALAARLGGQKRSSARRIIGQLEMRAETARAEESHADGIWSSSCGG